MSTEETSLLDDMSAWETAAYLAADQAIETNKPVHLDTYGVWVIPDTVMVEMTAQHGNPPPTFRLARDDGRSAYLFRGPARRRGEKT